MTLSNFDWTDKASVKWFLLLPTGHEGPYSLDALQKREISLEAKIWAEGLINPISFREALKLSQGAAQENLEVPALPPLPEEEVNLPPLPIVDETIPEKKTLQLSPEKMKKWIAPIGLLLLLIIGANEWVKSLERFSIHRMPKMSPDLFQRISNDFKFEGWNKKIFLKEYVPVDMSHIWLVTSSYHNCQVEAQFSSLKDKLLTKLDEKVMFRTSANLSNHIVEFSRFDFSSGNKIIPGLYEMDLKATHCKWDGLSPKLANFFNGPDEDYVTRMRVVLYHKGSAEFNSILDKLIRTKIEQQIKNQSKEELFWQDLQQKFQTLLAISLQIEQHLLDFLDVGPVGFDKKLKPTVDVYTKKYGHFLTNFVVAHEGYFKDLEKSGLSNISKKRSYESLINMTSKKIGYESMKIIEELQTFKKPTPQDLKNVSSKVKVRFQELKEIINKRIIQITEDQAN